MKLSKRLVYEGMQFLLVHRMDEPARFANRILHLDGNDSYVELPDGLLNGLNAATIELWVRVERFMPDSRFLQFGRRGQELYLAQDQDKASLKLLYTDGARERHRITARDLVALNRWFHMAAVLTETNAQLFFNGVLVGELGHPARPGAIDSTRCTSFRPPRDVCPSN